MSKKESEENMDAAFLIRQTNKRERELKPYKPNPQQDEPPGGEPEEPEGIVPVVAATKEENRRRKGKGQDYESLFIRNVPISTRSGKTVYIRKEFHDRIIRIVQVIGANELSLFSYLDNVLEHHFKSYQEDIQELYDTRNPDIF